ncbi:MAG: hypothetical protein HOV80_36905 [Polyangiaceae bacterium]|nr:hypothetical protein [Polyangiaceae bacterium]
MRLRSILAATMLFTAARTAWADEPRSAGDIADALLGLPADAPAEQREALKIELAAAKKRVATVIVKVESAEGPIVAKRGRVLVDDKEAATLPLARPLYLEPGKRRITIEAPDRRYVPIEADLQADKTVAVTLREAPAQAPPAATTDEKPLWPGIVLAAIGAAGLGTGIGLIVVSKNKESDAETMGADIGTCNPSSLDAACSELASTVSDRNAFQNGAVVSFIVGGVAAAASIVYFAIPTPHETPEGAASPVALTPIIGPSVWGLSVGGAF